MPVRPIVYLQPSSLNCLTTMTSPLLRAAPKLRTLSIAALGLVSAACHAQAITAAQLDALDTGAAAEQAKVVSWRRDIHQHPELSGQEVRTAALVADHLRRLGMEVSTGVGGHGVIGLLKGSQPGKTVVLRADMDALPIKEPQALRSHRKRRSRTWDRNPLSRTPAVTMAIPPC